MKLVLLFGAVAVIVALVKGIKRNSKALQVPLSL